MSFVITVPAALAAAAADVAGIGSSLGEANSAAAAPTTGLLAAAEDEVSAAVTSLFSGYAHEFQAFWEAIIGGLLIAGAIVLVATNFERIREI